MTLTEARYVYACLGELADRMSNDGCNDWQIKSEADREFAQAVENHGAADEGREPERVGDYATNWTMVLYLQKRLVEEFGEDLECTAAELGFV